MAKMVVKGYVENPSAFDVKNDRTGIITTYYSCLFREFGTGEYRLSSSEMNLTELKTLTYYELELDIRGAIRDGKQKLTVTGGRVLRHRPLDGMLSDVDNAGNKVGGK